MGIERTSSVYLVVDFTVLPTLDNKTVVCYFIYTHFENPRPFRLFSYRERLHYNFVFVLRVQLTRLQSVFRRVLYPDRVLESKPHQTWHAQIFSDSSVQVAVQVNPLRL